MYIMLHIFLGESGDIEHLAVSFMVAHSIAHGILLQKSPVLQYL